MYDIESLGTINLGKKGESGAVLQFDLTDWLADHVAGTATIHAVRPGEALTSSYTPTGVAMNVDGTTLEWTLSTADLEISGNGIAEIYLEDTGVEIKPFNTFIAFAIGDTSGVLSDPRLLDAAGDLLTFTTVPAKLAIGAAGSILTSSGTAPQWTAIGTTGKVLTSNGTAPTWATPNVSRYVTAPAAGNSAGTIGDWAANANYIYACYAENTWVRCAKTAW